MKFEIMSSMNTLSTKTFFSVHLNAGEQAQVGHEAVYGPAWAVITSHQEPRKEKNSLVWNKGEVRYSAQSPTKKVGTISRAWARHFNPQLGFIRPGTFEPIYWELPQFNGELHPEYFPVWRIEAAGGFTPEVPEGFVAVNPCFRADTSWLMMRENDPRIQTVETW